PPSPPGLWANTAMTYRGASAGAMPMNEATSPGAYLPSLTCRPVPVLPATRYPGTAAECPVAPGAVTTASRSWRSAAAQSVDSTCRVRGAGHGLTFPSGPMLAWRRCGATYAPLLAIVAYHCAI